MEGSGLKILVINAILYTSETACIKRVPSIKDTMIYDLCLGFYEAGHEVTLAAGEPYKPSSDEIYPFEILWWKCSMQRIFKPNCFPYMPETYRYVKKNRSYFDLIISSEVFSMNSLAAYRAAPGKTIIWHELAKHNAIFKKVPSKLWYGAIARLLMRDSLVVARSEEARAFISRYCRNTSDAVIDHGVNLDLFQPCEEKENYFIVCSQLIARKRIDGIIRVFKEYVERCDSSCRLYIVGCGELRENLRAEADRLGISDNVVFTGKLGHRELVPLMAKAQALLVNTEKDNSMISIVESIAVGTPVLTTSVPLNASYIQSYHLGIVKDDWGVDELREVVSNSAVYVRSCIEYRESLSTKVRAAQFIAVASGK